MRLVVSSMIVALEMFVAGVAYAQLSAADIEALRKRGEEEGWTFTVGENDATRLPLHALCGSVVPPDWDKLASFDPCTPRPGLDSQIAYDWRAWNCVTPIRHQQQCGSCWAFGALGTMESLIFINDGVGTDLSEQWLVSCTNAGSCSGGFHGSAFNYLECGGLPDPCGDSGAVWESDFPYVASNAPCGCPYPHPYCLGDWHYVGFGPPVRPSVAQIKQAMLDHGPVAVSVWSDAAFRAYTGGVFNACVGTLQTNHAVVLVGWDDSQGTSGVWILRNSWGESWGEKGYMLIEYDCSNVGMSAAYVEYADTNAGVWVDFSHGGPETGSFWWPYNTLSEGINAVATGGVVSIKAGSTSGAITISKALTLRAGGGTVTIGQ